MKEANKMHKSTSPKLSRVAWLTLLAVLSLLPSARALAVDCGIPPVAQQDIDGINVMILADNSYSMNAPIEHEDYDENNIYTGTFTSTAEYYVTRTKACTPYSFKQTWASAPSAVLVESDNGEDGIYRGNYLNWIFYHATAAQRAFLPQQTRIQLLKSILADLVFRSSGLDFGLTVFQNEHGGSIIGQCGVNQTSLVAQIAGITANAWTPLAESSETILDYFADNGPSAPITVPCRRNFLIVVTDGEPTRDLDVSPYLQDADGDGRDPGNCASIGSLLPNSYDCSEYFDDVTWYMAHTDLRPDMDGDQHIATYVVGYKIDLPLLQSAAEQGDGLYFQATNAWGLLQSLDCAVQDIQRRIAADSDVTAVPDDTDVLPTSLLTVAPNPSSGRTTITWSGDKAAPAAFRIYDLAGSLVRSFETGDADGSQIIWDGRDHRGVTAPAGAYLVRMVRGDGSFVTRKLLLTR
jgi:type IV pilus assembly protein PilY1